MHVVVESPAKARTLRGCLGAGHAVIATRGHVQDLAAKDGSVDPARGFAMVYATKRGATRALGAIATALADAEALVLATDPDREGEAIAWQVLEWLREKEALEGRAVRRVVFHEITPEAVREAMARPRGHGRRAPARGARRRRTRPSGRRTSRSRRSRSPGGSARTRPRSTRSSGSARWRARWPRPGSSARGSSSRRRPATSRSRPPASAPCSTASSGCGARASTRTAGRRSASGPCPRWPRASGSS